MPPYLTGGPHRGSHRSARTERSSDSHPLRRSLSKLIGNTPTSIRTFATNKKYKRLIPRPSKLPHSRRLRWYEHEVLEWIDSTQPERYATNLGVP